MANYNPSTPIILGEEWVPIREENIIFNEQVNSVEMGHSFVLPQATQLAVGRFYANKPPGSAVNNHAYTMSVYPKGQEDKSGPIHSVIIPCNSVSATGLPAVQVGTLDNVTRVSNSSADPDLGILIQQGGANTTDVAFFFATNQYATLLADKRILGVNLLMNYRVPATFGQSTALQSNLLNGIFLQLRNDSNTIRVNFPFLVDDFSIARTNNPKTIRYGDIDRFFGGSVANTVDVIPVTYTGFLTKFEATSGAARIHFHVLTRPSAFVGPYMYLNYMALEVFYCEETRVAFGTRIFNPWAQTPFLTESPIMRGIQYQTNPVVMRDLAGTANPTLQPGEYVVTVNQANLGDDLEVSINAGPHAELNALRELYAIPGISGRLINIPSPPDSGSTSPPHTMTAEYSAILPQLSLHVSGGTPFPQVHVYGRQAIGQVYGTVTVTQEILDSVAGVNAFYPWVRFYARRFGDTTVPLRLTSASPTVSGAGVSVYITPDQWDALPEILDRWKEVTLRFPDATPPVMGSGWTPVWRWSATGELKGNRWEVLGAIAPAISGLPGNNLNLAVPPASQLGSATYGQPSAGTTVNMGWIPQYGPYVSGTADDTTSDAVLMFSQDPPPVSGFTVSLLSQPLSGIGLDCGLNPRGIPTSLGYHRITWTQQTAMRVAQEFRDTFETPATNTWPPADTGQPFQIFGGNASDYNVANGFGTINLSDALNTRNAYTGPVAGGTFTDYEMTGEVIVPVVATGANYFVALMGREDFNNDNMYTLLAEFRTSGAVDVFIERDLGGVFTTLATATSAFTYAAGNVIGYRFRFVGTTIYGKIWNRSTSVEPSAWTVIATDSAIASGGLGVRQVRDTGNTNSNLILRWDNLLVTDLSAPTFGAYELQRMDTVEPTWKTIMLSSTSSVSGFNDYEARVGILSSYRMRILNAYGFYGPWSTTRTSTITAPGVAVGVVGGHVLIFTTNSRQDGSSNLAYLPIWDAGQTISEDFVFPEAGFVQLQAMYNKDFFTAFRPLERGGERFQRTILVQAAAISPETLADFTSLRNMAWDSVPYICVRDEDGNRWFATISVPAGRAQRGRRLYEANIDIVEVSDTPSQVDP